MLEAVTACSFTGARSTRGLSYRRFMHPFPTLVAFGARTANLTTIGPWAQAGPIIEREKIYVKPTTRLVKGWRTYQLDETGGGICNSQYGSTPLVAAMRCYVASRLGDVVDVPKELV